jgi:hypothetical protein
MDIGLLNFGFIPAIIAIVFGIIILVKPQVLAYLFVGC